MDEIKVTSCTDIKVQLINAIQQNHNDRVQGFVDQLAGVNISEPEVKAKLPKRVHQIATTCMTTPLRISISYRNLESMRYILTSYCVITDADKSLALQKILATTSVAIKLEEVEYIRLLIKHGAVVKNITHIATALHNSFNNDRVVFDALVKAILQDGNNEQKGLLLMGFYLKDRNPRPGSAAKKLPTKQWETAMVKCTEDVFLSGFDPDYYIKNNIDNIKDHARLMQALPDLLQMCTSVDNFNIANILRKTAFHYPLVNIESKHIISSLCQFLVMLGYNISLINDIAKCSKKFNDILGFTKAENSNMVFPLQDICRIKIRTSITQPNVLLGIQGLNLPARLSSYCLMSDMTNVINSSKQSLVTFS